MSEDRRRWLFAEFLVVVLGVLTALGVDALVTRVNEARTLDEYRQRLEADLRADTKFLADRAVWHQRLVGYGEITRDVLAKRPTGRPADEEFLAAFMASNSHPFSANSSTWEDLVNTGSLSLFDLETRSRLTVYYTQLPRSPVAWDLPDEYRNRVRRLVRPEQVVALNHVECAFRGLFENRPDSQLKPDPTPQDCRTSLGSDEAEVLLEGLRGLGGLEGDLNLRMAEALLVVQNARQWISRADELVDHLDSF